MGVRPEVKRVLLVIAPLLLGATVGVVLAVRTDPSTATETIAGGSAEPPPGMRVADADQAVSTVTSFAGSLAALGTAAGDGVETTAADDTVRPPATSPTAPLPRPSGTTATSSTPAAGAPSATGAPSTAPSSSPSTVPSTAPATTGRSSTTVAPSATPAAATGGGVVPVGVPGQWTIAFADEFDQSSLDTGRWEPGWFASTGFSRPINVDEDGCYHPSQIRVANGALELTAKAATDPGCRRRDGSTAGYVSGLINTRNSFTYTTGYVEARMYLPGSGGRLHNWPALWTNGANWPTTGEIDIMEGLTTHWPCFSYHRGPGHVWDTTCVEGGDATGWHTFGVDRQAGRLDFYYDGRLVGTYTEGLTSDPHYLVLNYGITAENGITVPSTLKVDYVRVWSRR
ncbi:MAG: family 16 glycosylhydrolase [Acidimicrobiales bacterium]